MNFAAPFTDFDALKKIREIEIIYFFIPTNLMEIFDNYFDILGKNDLERSSRLFRLRKSLFNLNPKFVYLIDRDPSLHAKFKKRMLVLLFVKNPWHEELLTQVPDCGTPPNLVSRYYLIKTKKSFYNMK